MNKLKVYLVKNWKTSVAGLLLLVVVPTLVQSGTISTETAGVVTTILAGLGFAVSKDGDKSGV